MHSFCKEVFIKPELQRLYNYFIIDRTHRSLRVPCEVDFASAYSALGLSHEERMCRRFETLMAMETPRILPDEEIVLTRSVMNGGSVLTSAEWEALASERFVWGHNAGASNISLNYETMISRGFDAYRETATPIQLRMMDAVTNLCDRYRTLAKEQGRADVVAVFDQIPRCGARNFREALQFFRVLHFSLWVEDNCHNTVGRFD